MKKPCWTMLASCLLVIGACADDPVPISVTEFMEDPRILEATMVRCAQNRTESKYLADCLNAREAVNRLEAAAERARREGLEKQSERKRQALRRTQEAAATARRLALENQRRREEEEYLGNFDQVPQGRGVAGGNNTMPQQTEMPSATTPQPAQPVPVAPSPEAPEEENSQPPTDLGAIREELKRRQESPE